MCVCVVEGGLKVSVRRSLRESLKMNGASSSVQPSTNPQAPSAAMHSKVGAIDVLTSQKARRNKGRLCLGHMLVSDGRLLVFLVRCVLAFRHRN